MTVEFVGGNRLQLLATGAEYFPALEAGIAAARREIFLETYIYAGDPAARRVTAALAAAARRGVAVRVTVDGFGSRDMPQDARAALRDAGVRLLVYRPDISPWTLRRERLRRLHRKLVAIDGAVAFIGGINVTDDYEADGLPQPRYDYAVRIDGPLATEVRRTAARLWARIVWASLKRRTHALSAPPPACLPCGDVPAALVVRDNLRHRSDIEDAYLAAIDAAREEIILANAYFFPGRRLRHALVRAARRGVRVVLLLQGRGDHPLIHYASQALYGTLLDTGVEIYEYQKSVLHAKVAVIDRCWATVGSSNIDPFSLLLAREANVMVDNRAFADALRLSLLRAMEEGAIVVAPKLWRHRPWHQRARIWLAYALTRFLIGMAGYGGML